MAHVTTLRLKGCHIVSLRPVGGHDAMRRAALREGAHVLALSPWRIVARSDAAAHDALRAALCAPRVVFTSPAAVHAATQLQPLHARAQQQWLAVGAGTARALRRAGIAHVSAPARMDSEGLLALEGLRDVQGIDIGMVTAPGGRGQIPAVLQQRGARVLRANVYERQPLPPSPAAHRRLQAIGAQAWWALSSGEALALTLQGLPASLRTQLSSWRAVAASARLAEVAHDAGFHNVEVAASALPRDLIAAIPSAH